MCAILDNSVVTEVFGENRPPAGEKFFRWLNEGRGLLVLGGKLREELGENKKFSEWLKEAIRAGRVKSYKDAVVNKKTEKLRKAQSCRSNDQHVVALAQVSGARLLYANDVDLQKDFQNRCLIDNPRGKIYSTRKNRNFGFGHKQLLNDGALCKRA